MGDMINNMQKQASSNIDNQKPIQCVSCGRILARCSIEYLAYSLGYSHIIKSSHSTIVKGTVNLSFSCNRCRMVNKFTFSRREISKIGE